MQKTHVYFVPGLAASPQIFEHINLPTELYELHFLEWIKPINQKESIEDYAKRMCKKITQKKPVLIGVSFGGILVQEMSRFLNVKKIIIISSVKSNKEFPTRLKLIQKSKIYKLFPVKIIENIEDYTKFFFGKHLQKRSEIYKKYLSVRNKTYLQWSIYNVLHWQQKKPLKNTVHIHGTDDSVFPIKNIKNTIKIDKGTHVMILTKAKKISEIIHQNLTF